MSSKTFPSLSSELALFESGHRFVVGIDEVGRGALFGPVAVGVTVYSVTDSRDIPAGLADSKLLSEAKREALFEPVGAWVSGWAVGMASNDEIDSQGITWALAASAERAIRQLPQWLRADIAADASSARAILDGSHNWLGSALGPVAVTVQTKADRDCASVAAASVLAKVTRDRMVAQWAEEQPELEPYGIAGNKGYSSAKHLEALRELGPTSLHRKTWLGRILGEAALF